MSESQSHQDYDHDTVKHTFAELLQNLFEDTPDVHITTEKHLAVEDGRRRIDVACEAVGDRHKMKPIAFEVKTEVDSRYKAQLADAQRQGWTSIVVCPDHSSEIFIRCKFGVMTYTESGGLEFECTKPGADPVWDIIRQSMPACVEKQEPHKGFFNKIDKEILRFMREDGDRLTPKWIADETGNARPYVSQRLKRMKEHNIVANPGYGLWTLENDPREVEQ
jgi:hypothetical protein